MIIVLLSAVI